MKPSRLCSAALAAFSFLESASDAAVIHFDDLPLSPSSFDFPDDGNTVAGLGAQAPWITGPATFNRYVDDEWLSWAGFTYANGTDATTPGFGNQQSTSTGAAASGTQFALAYHDTFSPVIPTLHLSAGHFPVSLEVTNTTYAAQYMLSGLDGFADDPANRYGGATGTDPDFLRLSITGLDAADLVTGVVEFYLADYRFADPADDYVSTVWNLIDLTPLGTDTQTLTFSLSSSDSFTPFFFAMDNLVTAPEPNRLVLLFTAGLGLIIQRRRRPTSLPPP